MSKTLALIKSRSPSTQPALHEEDKGELSTQPALQSVQTNSVTSTQPALPPSLQSLSGSLAQSVDIKTLLTIFPSSQQKRVLNMRVDGCVAGCIDDLAKQYGTTKTAIVEQAVRVLAAILKN